MKYHKKAVQPLGRNLWFFPILLIVFLVTYPLHLIYAQSDTLTVRGKVENLTLRLFRQAPAITVSRVNSLQPNREMVRVSQLQPDGSFELKVPLIYPKEECFLNYAAISVPFLGEKGTVEVIIDGDSLAKSEIPLRFGGLNAATNNRHTRFDVAFKKWLKANPEKPSKTDTSPRFWEKEALERDRRIEFYRTFSSVKDPLLDHWVISSLQEATKAKFFNFLTQERQTVPLGLLSAVELDTARFFTFAKADCYRQFTNHALAVTPDLPEGALPVNKLATLILQYVPNLSVADSLKLVGFVQGESAKMRDLKWLNSLFNRKEDTLKHITAYELYLRKYSAAYSKKELDYLKAAYYAGSLNMFTGNKMAIWYDYIRPTLQNPFYVRALDELHHVESLDSTAIREANEKIYSLTAERTAGRYMVEISSGIEVYRDSYRNGYDVWNEIKKKTKGKTVYALFWTNDEFGRRALAESRELRASLPEEKVAFVYFCEHTGNEDIWLENVVKSKTRGLHVKLEETQTDFLVSAWGIDHVPYAVLIDANGKYLKRDAPLPADQEGWDKIWDRVFR